MGMARTIKQYEIYWINLDPTVGSEIQKTRPGVVITPDEMNKNDIAKLKNIINEMLVE
jgi:mRNA interferase MazF